ncbi:MAG TPA: hypothetical protein VEK82_07135 [Stellaceae bacterium]|nr:hypothetical protein [Stellaceae bacterium]
MRGHITAIALVAVIAGCSSAPDKADDPSEIAYATCLEYRSGDPMPCRGLRLPDPASQVAYGMCLEYHPKDAAPCNRLRNAYRADLRAYLESLKAAAGSDPAKAGQAPRLDSRRVAELHHTAEELYKATSRDADIFANALLVAAMRRHVEGILGRPLSDQELRALADQSRAEAVYWYKYMQGLERAYPAAGREPQPGLVPRGASADPPG